MGRLSCFLFDYKVLHLLHDCPPLCGVGEDGGKWGRGRLKLVPVGQVAQSNTINKLTFSSLLVIPSQTALGIWRLQ